MSYNSKYTGAEVEDLLDIVAEGGGGGGSYDDTELRNAVAMRNVAAVDVGSELGDPPDYATVAYVNTAIANAITNIINSDF